MISSLPPSPDLEHLRREAKHLLRRLQAGDPAAVARLDAHTPGLPAALGTAQLVVAREHGFASWAQLKSLLTRMASSGVRYDTIGPGYADYRRADPRIAAAVHDALGDARTIVNVGAALVPMSPATGR